MTSKSIPKGLPCLGGLGSFELSLGPLRASASFLQSVLLAFLHSRVTAQESFLLQHGPEVRVVFDERARDSKTDRVRLTGDPSPLNRHLDIQGLSKTCRDKGGLCALAKRRHGNKLIKSSLIHFDRSRSSMQDLHLRHGALASAKSMNKRFCFRVFHIYFLNVKRFRRAARNLFFGSIFATASSSTFLGRVSKSFSSVTSFNPPGCIECL